VEEIQRDWEFVTKKITESVSDSIEEEEEEEEDSSGVSFEGEDMGFLLKDQMEKFEEIKKRIMVEREELEKMKKESEIKKTELEKKRNEIEGKVRWVFREKERKLQEAKEKDVLKKKESTKNIILEKAGEVPKEKTAEKIKLSEGEVKIMPFAFEDLEKKSKKKSNFVFGFLITILILGILFGAGYLVFHFKDKISLVGKIKIPDCKNDQACFEEKFQICEPAKFTPSIDLGALGGVITYDYEIIEPIENFCSIKMKFLKNPNPEWVRKEMICGFDNKKDFQISGQEVFDNVN